MTNKMIDLTTWFIIFDYLVINIYENLLDNDGSDMSEIG